jgi:phosphoesterase RecJ-like protein
MPIDDRYRPDLQRVARAIDGGQRIGVVGHVGPDGDALGSAIALAQSARGVGKDAVASFGEPFVVPAEMSFLDLSTLVSPADFPGDLEVVVACDTAARDRLGSLASAAESAGTLVVIDHHRSNDGFGDVVLIDPEAGATTQLVFYLLEELGWPIEEPVATALYTGLVTDTGRFQYSSTTPEVHRVAAQLLAAGVQPDAVGQRLFEETPFGYYTVLARVMGRAVLEPDRGLVWSVLEKGDLEAAGIGYEATDGLIDSVRVAEEADVACLLKEKQPGTLKGSLRSRGAVDVAAIAAVLGGGGHHNAAGFTYKGTADAAMTQIRELLGR